MPNVVQYNKYYIHKETGLLFTIQFIHKDYVEVICNQYQFICITKPEEFFNDFKEKGDDNK